MANGQILGFESKTFWRTARLLFWSGIVALALALAISAVSVTQAPTLVGVIMLAALWVASYHGLQWLRR